MEILMKARWKILIAVGVFLAVFIGIQFVPSPHTNPPVTREVSWDSPATRALAQRACMDCHSNLTEWPWYSYIAPVRFLVVNDVNGGRKRMNFSEWNKAQRATAEDIEDRVGNNEMPPKNYVMAHPLAKLTPAEIKQLVDGMRVTYQKDPPGASIK